MTIEQYIESVNKRYRLGNATEHTFRGDLQQLIESLVPGINATNEPQRQACGAPDYILTKKEIPIGYIEAKDIGDADLDGTKKNGNKEQFDRYKASLSNIIFTDYINFHLYREGEFVTKIAIAELTPKGIKPLPENFSGFTIFIKSFTAYAGQTIKGSKKLAMMMADKAKLLAIIIEKALAGDELNQQNSTLKDQLTAFKQILIHDITAKGFADVYAQTIAYGMFAARLHDPTLPTFSRQEAAELIPKSNPFLRKLFGYIAGPDIDDRIKWIVDDLTEIFLACNVEEILANFGKATKTEDPIIHFYETFLSEYDPKLRKARGVWYTPAPVVNFIVRAVDDILKAEFNLPQGLADNSKTKIKVNLQATDKRYKENIRTIEEEVHRVQILDPAAGTGTFLAEVVKQIYAKFKSQQGIWSDYVETNLLPRLNGFEILMASYAMAHLKLDLLLKETGYKPTHPSFGGAGGGRLRVYLTNSLEESHPETGTLFANWLSTEANEANYIKRDTPVMCVIGNPPYAVSSSNKGKWIQNLISEYKKDLKEQKINLDDDYIKFIRYGQHFIDKNGSGILAYISNNSFLDGITHRQMRKHLLESFDKIYILDLHGNSKKREVSPDGSIDQNVFDIMQGVSINIFVKTGKKRKVSLGSVYHSELFGKREDKYKKLINDNIKNINWVELSYTRPNMFFVPKNFDESILYDSYISLDDLFLLKGPGCKTERDGLNIKFDFIDLKNILLDFINLDENSLRIKYNLNKDSRDWKVNWAKKDVTDNFNDTLIKEYLYRPFDKRYIYYSGISKGFVGTPGYKRFANMFKENIGLIYPRMCKGRGGFQHGFISKNIIDVASGDAFSGAGTFFAPLYLYPLTSIQQNVLETAERTPNLKPEIVKEIGEKLGLTFVHEKTSPTPPKEGLEKQPSGSLKQGETFAPIDILDYIYAVLHSPAYREKYKEFLKIDFPRVPYPKDKKTFWKLVKLGGELREIHLLESPQVEKFKTKYPVAGDNVVDKPKYIEVKSGTGKVYINSSQYFENVPDAAWNFYIGGYQPAQKWLKDRKGRKLEFDDILHYQKIIVALTETGRLMSEIDKVGVE